MTRKIIDRIYWIDWLKVFGMVLVVYAHIDTQSVLNRFIFSFHMPLFFIISGFLNKHRTFKDECKVVFKSLFIPYFILSSLLIPLCSEPVGRLLFYISTGSLENVPLLIRPLWFVYSLALIRLFSSIINKSVMACILTTILSLCLFILLYYFNFISKETDFFQINTTIMAFPFFMLGFYLQRYFCYIIKYKLLILILSLPFFYFSIVNGNVNMFRCSAGNHLFLFYLNASFISTFFIFLFQSLFSHLYSDIIKTTSMGLIVVLASHLFIATQIDKLTFHSFHPVVLTFFVMVIGSTLSYVTLKYFPFILGKSFK